MRISGAALNPRTIEPGFRLILRDRGLGQRRLFGSPKFMRVWRRTLDIQAMAVSPFKFLQEVRSETAKVTWPTRRETTITTIMVFVMVAVASIFFFAADQIIRYLITFLLGIH
jgi:preprotein translocase subunit SecE